jgi:hypothetical protein
LQRCNIFAAASIGRHEHISGALMRQSLLSWLLAFCESIGVPFGMAPDDELGFPERHARSR